MANEFWRRRKWKSEMFMTTKTSEENVQIGLEKHTLAFGSIISNDNK